MYLFKTHLIHIVILLMHVPLYFGYLDSGVYFCIPFRYMLGENTGRFIMFSVITNIYNKKTKGPTLMECSQPQEN